MAPRSLYLAALSCMPLALVNAADCAPGGNFDLSYWSLQLPTGDGSMDTIRSKDLQGCDGYSDEHFYMDGDAMVLTAPGNPDETGCVTSGGSTHCRTELREVLPDTGKNAAWSPKGTNVLKVAMKVVQADDGSHGTAIGQVFASKPVAEMYYSRDGKIVVGVKPDPNSNQIVTKLATVPLGTEFDYEMSYSGDALSITINGEVTELDTYDWDSPDCYFKAGNYNQGKSGDESEVHISSIEVIHE
ncbi:hypothetical protein ACO1O0_008114 [Amphichorda felina]